MTEKYNELALCWGETVSPAVGPTPPSVGVGLWSYLTGQPWLRWSRYEEMPSFVGKKTVLINLFHVLNATPISDIKKRYPDAVVVAMPDASLDMTLEYVNEWPVFWEELSQADAIFGRTQADTSFYSSLTSKPCWTLPSPAGPEEWFRAQWREKEPFILSLDHLFAPSNTAYNVVHLLEVQSQTGLPVKYLNPKPQTIKLAKIGGLAVEWIERLSFVEAVKLTARALLSVDIYSSHALGRHQIVCGYVKTPCIASPWIRDAPGVSSIIENPGMSGSMARTLLDDTTYYQLTTKSELDMARQFDFVPSLARLDSALSELKGLFG